MASRLGSANAQADQHHSQVTSIGMGPLSCSLRSVHHL